MGGRRDPDQRGRAPPVGTACPDVPGAPTHGPRLRRFVRAAATMPSAEVTAALACSAETPPSPGGGSPAPSWPGWRSQGGGSPSRPPPRRRAGVAPRRGCGRARRRMWATPFFGGCRGMIRPVTPDRSGIGTRGHDARKLVLRLAPPLLYGAHPRPLLDQAHPAAAGPTVDRARGVRTRGPVAAGGSPARPGRRPCTRHAGRAALWPLRGPRDGTSIRPTRRAPYSLTAAEPDARSVGIGTSSPER